MIGEEKFPKFVLSAAVGLVVQILVNAAFVLALGAVAVAFAIAFGVGGRDFAKKQLGNLDEAIDKIKADSKAINEEKEKAE